MPRSFQMGNDHLKPLGSFEHSSLWQRREQIGNYLSKIWEEAATFCDIWIRLSEVRHVRYNFSTALFQKIVITNDKMYVAQELHILVVQTRMIFRLDSYKRSNSGCWSQNRLPWTNKKCLNIAPLHGKTNGWWTLTVCVWSSTEMEVLPTPLQSGMVSQVSPCLNFFPSGYKTKQAFLVWMINLFWWSHLL